MLLGTIQASYSTTTVIYCPCNTPLRVSQSVYVIVIKQDSHCHCEGCATQGQLVSSLSLSQSHCLCMDLFSEICLFCGLPYFPKTATVALWLRRPPREREVVGSIPGRVIGLVKFVFFVVFRTFLKPPRWPCG